MRQSFTDAILDLEVATWVLSLSYIQWGDLNVQVFLFSTTPKGFEPLRAEPNGFLVHLLGHSDTVSCKRRVQLPPS